MPYPRRLLNDNEEVVLDLRPHWLFLALPTVALVAVILLAIFIATRKIDGAMGKTVNIVGLVVLVAAVGYFVQRWCKWITTMFVLTTDRLITRHGIVSKSGVEIPLDRINTVFFHQGLLERVVGAGNLTIESASETGSSDFSHIRHPEMVQREIYVQMEHNENRKFDRAAGANKGAGQITTAEQLEKLHGLLQQGALTPEQYEAEKAKLIGR